MIQEQVNPQLIPIIARQISQLIKQPIDGIYYNLSRGVRIIYNEIDVLDIQAEISGPVGTPFEGGEFRCKLIVPPQFPQVAPKGYFITKIFHPNVSEKGEICVNTLKKDWDSAQWSFKHIFEVIKCLLIVPFPESSLNEEAGKLFMENYDEFCKHAKIFTELYARSAEEKSVLKGLNNQMQEEQVQNNQQKPKGNMASGKKENEQKKWLKRI